MRKIKSIIIKKLERALTLSEVTTLYINYIIEIRQKDKIRILLNIATDKELKEMFMHYNTKELNKIKNFINDNNRILILY